MKVVPLSKGAVALVDDDDLDAVTTAGPWHVVECDGHLYARRAITNDGESFSQYLHTFLTGYKLTDHVNGLGLDNRRANLREATASQNSLNRERPKYATNPYRGVYFHPASGLWAARIHKDRRAISLKYHHTPEAAARAYDRAARELHGDFARLNFPEETAA